MVEYTEQFVSFQKDLKGKFETLNLPIKTAKFYLPLWIFLPLNKHIPCCPTNSLYVPSSPQLLSLCHSYTLHVCTLLKLSLIPLPLKHTLLPSSSDSLFLSEFSTLLELSQKKTFAVEALFKSKLPWSSHSIVIFLYQLHSPLAHR